MQMLWGRRGNSGTYDFLLQNGGTYMEVGPNTVGQLITMAGKFLEVVGRVTTGKEKNKRRRSHYTHSKHHLATMESKKCSTV